jgi:hypothetical protein
MNAKSKVIKSSLTSSREGTGVTVKTRRRGPTREMVEEAVGEASKRSTCGLRPISKSSPSALRTKVGGPLEERAAGSDPKTPPIKIRTHGSYSEDGLNPREQIAVAEVLKGQPAYKACLTAGYSESTAMTKAGDILAKPRVQRALLQAMEAAGITETLLAKKLFKGLKARKTIFHEGIPTCEVKDLGTRHKYLTTALELRGDLHRNQEAEEGSFEEVLFQVRARRVLPS